MSATEMLVPAERGVAAAFTADGMRQALAQRFHDAGLESPSARRSCSRPRILNEDAAGKCRHDRCGP